MQEDKSKIKKHTNGKLTKDHLDEVMHGRHSLFPRQFTGEKIENDVILQLLEYANTAPNHKKTRPWRFVVFSNQSLFKLIDFMQDYYLKHTAEEKTSKTKLDSFQERKEKVSHIIAIVMHRDELHRLPEIEEIAAVSCAVQNIYLSLKTFGLGGYWSTGEFAYSHEANKYLNLEAGDKCLGFFILGKVNTEIPFPERESVELLVTWKK